MATKLWQLTANLDHLIPNRNLGHVTRNVYVTILRQTKLQTQRNTPFYLQSLPADFSVTTKLGAAEKLEDFSYDQLIEILTKHYDPAPSQIMQRYKFHTRERGPSESIANYVAELKSIGGLCGFQDTLPDMLRDRLVCGVNDGRIQRALLQEHNLTFERALEIAQSIEAAANDMQRLKIQPSQDQTVHRVYSKQTTYHLIDYPLLQMWILRSSANRVSFQISYVQSLWKERPYCQGLPQQAAAAAVTVQH